MKLEPKAGHPTAIESAKRLSVYASESRSEVMRLLFTKAGHSGLAASELAKLIVVKLPSLNDYANTRRPRIGTVEKFLRALKVQHPKIAARALLGELRPEDELRIGQLIMYTFVVRSARFKDQGAYNTTMYALRSLDRKARRGIMARFLLADDGLLDADPVDTLAAALRQHGFDLSAHFADASLARLREAYIALLWAREALAMKRETWLLIKAAVAPCFDGYPGWRWPTESDTESVRATHDREVVLTGATMRARLRKAYEIAIRRSERPRRLRNGRRYYGGSINVRL